MELFKTSDPSLQKHAAVLAQYPTNVFVTKQVVDEVNRNKLRVASTFIDEQLKKVGLPSVSLPGFTPELTKTLKDLTKSVGELKKDAEREATDYLDRLAKSEDDVSSAESAFRNSTPRLGATDSESPLTKGTRNPPWKRNPTPWATKSAGSNSSSRFLEAGDHVIIASADGDYCLSRQGSRRPDCFAKNWSTRSGQKELLSCAKSSPSWSRSFRTKQAP